MARRLRVIESGPCVWARRVAEWIEQRSSFYGLLLREGLGLWEAVPLAQIHRGSSGDQTHGGACRMERFILGEDVPDPLSQLTGKIDAGDLGAALASEALLPSGSQMFGAAGQPRRTEGPDCGNHVVTRRRRSRVAICLSRPRARGRQTGLPAPLQDRDARPMLRRQAGRPRAAPPPARHARSARRAATRRRPPRGR
jgi:hypothetical protein